MEPIEYQPIGIFQTNFARAYEVPRQGVLGESNVGKVKFISPIHGDCFVDLKGFERIWLIYHFHKNKTWKPKVMPPRGAHQKKSVLATRSPYRPNGIGMSCVRLLKVDDSGLWVSEHDILDGTPVLDIKPYLPYADSFVGASTGWVVEEDVAEISYTDSAEERLNWLQTHGSIDYKGILKRQLEVDPKNRKLKRVKNFSDFSVFSLQAWRFKFVLENQRVKVLEVYSGYTEKELLHPDSPVVDGPLHQEFMKIFNNLEVAGAPQDDSLGIPISLTTSKF